MSSKTAMYASLLLHIATTQFKKTNKNRESLSLLISALLRSIHISTYLIGFEEINHARYGRFFLLLSITSLYCLYAKFHSHII